MMENKAKLGANAMGVESWRIMRVMNLGDLNVLKTMFLPLKSVP